MIHEIQRELGSSILFVTHDMSVHANLADRLGIMYAGRLVEEGRTADVFRAPRHPYTAHLIASLPRLGDSAPKKGLEGAPPNLADPPPGCRFHPRCPRATEICRRETPPMDLAGARPSRRLLPSRAGAVDMSAAAARGRRRGADLCQRRPVLATPGHRRRWRQPAPRRRTAGDLHHRGRVGQRQDHARPHDPGHGGAQRRHDPLPGHRPRDDPRQARAACLHEAGPADLPEPLRGLQPDEAGRPLPVRHRPAHGGPRGRGRDRRGHRRRAEERRPVAGRNPRPLSARAVGRPAAARGDRAGADLEARAAGGRRAGVDDRRLAARLDRQPAARPARSPGRRRSSTSRTISPPPTTSATAS